MSTIPQTVPVPPELLLALVEAVEADFPRRSLVHVEARRARDLLKLSGVELNRGADVGNRTSAELRVILRGAAA